MDVECGSLHERSYEYELTPFLEAEAGDGFARSAEVPRELEAEAAADSRRLARSAALGVAAGLLLTGSAVLLLVSDHIARTASTKSGGVRWQGKDSDYGDYSDYRAGESGLDNAAYAPGAPGVPGSEFYPVDKQAYAAAERGLVRATAGASWESLSPQHRQQQLGEWPAQGAAAQGGWPAQGAVAQGSYGTGSEAATWADLAEPSLSSSSQPPPPPGAVVPWPAVEPWAAQVSVVSTSLSSTLTTTRTPTPTSTSSKTSTITSTSTETSTVASTATQTTTPSQTLFCFALMMSSGGERDLIEEQLGRHASIFACELTSVFSSGKVRLSRNGRHFDTEDIGDMHCEYGGPYGLALNSEIFVRGWKRVFEDANYLSADLTVKVDPDAVFFPDRLRSQLHKADAGANVYFNNCDQGLHGPIEVIARGGMETFAKGIVDCEQALTKEYKEWGEDVFVRHCLGLLKVDRVDDFQLLSEDHCFDEDPAHKGCTSGKVSFHPFKTVDAYLKCLVQAVDDEI